MSPRVGIGSRFLTGIGLLFLLAASAAQPVEAAGLPFEIFKIDSVMGKGIHNSLALDSKGVPHISYYGTRPFGGKILYASRTDTTWAIELVDSIGDVGYYTSLALDANDAPHITYFDNGNSDLRYATKAAGYWTTEIVDSAGSVGQYGSIALDSNGNPSITYYDNTTGALKYATKVNGAWTTEFADSVGNVGFYTSLAIDAADQPCVSYLDLEGGLKFARKTGSGGWSAQTVEDGVQVGAHSSLVLDASGFAHISYADLGAGRLRFANELPGGGWQTETVDGTDGAGSFTSLQLVGGTSPRISYIAETTHELRYATRVGFAWNIQVVDSGQWVDSFNSLKVDSEGNPKISYYDMIRADLKFADAAVRIVEPRGGELWGAGTSQKVIWAGVGPVDIYLSDNAGATYTKVTSTPTPFHETMVMVPSGWSTPSARAKVVRSSPLSSSESQGLFAIAPGLQSPWWTKLVDAAGLTGFTPSIALTKDGTPMISYWDTSTGSVRFASRQSGVWVAETIRATAGAHSKTPLAFSQYNVPSIAYFHNQTKTLNYAYKVGGTWNTQVVRTLTVPGEDCALALDKYSAPRMTYYESAPGRLVFIEQFGTSWADMNIDQGVGVGIMSALAIDTLGYPYVAYYDQPDGDLRFGTLPAGSWIDETVDSFGDVGAYPSVAVDLDRSAHVAYVDQTNRFLKYARRFSGGGWNIETVDYSGDVGGQTSIAIDPSGSPNILYHDLRHRELRYARRVSGTWRTEKIVPAVAAAKMSALAMGPDGNPRVAYLDENTFDLRYASAGVELTEPTAGARWPIGAHKTVRWDGIGAVNVSLSSDGTAFNILASGVLGGSYALVVPNPATSTARVRIDRTLPIAYSVSDTFTIDAGVDVIAFRADPIPFANGALVTWETDPTVPDLSGYKLERALDGVTYTTVLSLTTEKSFRDEAAGPGTKYRLTAINGVGGQIPLGEIEFKPRKALAAGPLPYKSGDLAISFAAVGSGTAPVPAEVRLYDLGGRLVRTIVRGNYPPGYQAAVWNGTDEKGHKVASGIYFLKSESGGKEVSMKITVLR